MKCSAFRITYLGDSNFPAVAITRRSGDIFYIANIVPRESGRMSMRDYNRVAFEFSRALKRYARIAGLGLAVKATSGLVGLKEIISSDKCRAMFERYLSLHPTSYHPLDIERLDAFICCLSRYARKTTDLELLKGWLIEEKSWSSKDANWCMERIGTGLSILLVNRSHY